MEIVVLGDAYRPWSEASFASDLLWKGYLSQLPKETIIDIANKFGPGHGLPGGNYADQVSRYLRIGPSGFGELIATKRRDDLYIEGFIAVLFDDIIDRCVRDTSADNLRTMGGLCALALFLSYYYETNIDYAFDGIAMWVVSSFLLALSSCEWPMAAWQFSLIQRFLERHEQIWGCSASILEHALGFGGAIQHLAFRSSVSPS